MFDLLVLAGAWGAAPPASLVFYPYGRQWPIDPGSFFQPLSAALCIAIVGALFSGWKTERTYRVWLWLPLAAFIVIWAATPTLFWPIIVELYRIATGKIVASHPETVALVRRWLIYDWLRIAVIAVGFLSSVRAISIPYLPRGGDARSEI